MTIDIDKLKALCDAATAIVADCTCDKYGRCSGHEAGVFAGRQLSLTATTTTRELIAEVERLRAELHHAGSENLAFNIKVAREINEARTQRDSARAALAQAERERDEAMGAVHDGFAETRRVIEQQTAERIARHFEFHREPHNLTRERIAEDIRERCWLGDGHRAGQAAGGGE